MLEYKQLKGRLRAIEELRGKGKLSLSVGSKETRLADVNTDIKPSSGLDVVADARFLPFEDGVFEQVLFTDVIEHLPKGDEDRALLEIHRVLSNGGEIILTTPHKNMLFVLLDPAWYLIRHRHFKKREIKKLLERVGFKIVELFTAGGKWVCVNVLLYCFVIYPQKKALDRLLFSTPYLFQSLEDEEYKGKQDNGYTIFVKAIKSM